jgi:hypothetical protein
MAVWLDLQPGLGRYMLQEANSFARKWLRRHRLDALRRRRRNFIEMRV